MENHVNAILSLAESDYDQFKLVVAKLLGGIDRTKPYGTALFKALARMTVTVACEAVALRPRPNSGGRLEIFLRRRAEDDTAYPGE